MFDPIRRWPIAIKGLITIAFMGAIAALVYAKMSKKPSLEDVAANYEQCFQSHDSKCLFQFATAAEKKALNLDEGKFVAFADKYVWPNIGTITRKGPSRTYLSQAGDAGANAANGTNRVFFAERKTEGPADQISLVQRYTGKDGKTAQFQFELVGTPEGIKSPNLVGGLYLDSLTAFAPKAEVRQWQKLHYYSEQTKRNLAGLQSSGVKGYIADARNLGNGDPVTWDEWVKYWDKSFARQGSMKPAQTDINPRGTPGR